MEVSRRHNRSNPQAIRTIVRRGGGAFGRGLRRYFFGDWLKQIPFLSVVMGERGISRKNERSALMGNRYSRHSDDRLYQLLGEEGEVRDRAFEEIYRRYGSRIWLYTAKVMGDRESAEDCFQGTFLRLLQRAAKDEGKREMSNLPGYLLRIARNLCLNTKAKFRPIPRPFDELDVPVEERTIESRELEGLISTALDLLPEEQREAFVLQAYNGLSYKEIAEVIDRPVSTVRNRVVRAKKKMREILTPYLADYRD